MIEQFFRRRSTFLFAALSLTLVNYSAFWKRNDSRAPHVIHCFFVTTEPEQRNINPKKYSSTSSFSTRFAKICHGS
jgi:hypothetical protein